MDSEVIEVTAQAVKPQTKEQYLETFSDNIAKEITTQKGTIETIIKRKNLEIDDFKRLLIEISSTNGLMDCTPKSIVSSAISLLELNLSLSKMIGQAYVLPFKNKGVSIATPIIGYKGWIALANREGVKIKATHIFKGDKYKIWSEDGFTNKVEYEKKIFEGDEAYMYDGRLEKVKDGNLTWNELNLIGVNIAINDNGNIDNIFVSHSKLRQIMGTVNNPVYEKWYIEMMGAKATKYVLSKMPFADEQLLKAIEIDIKSDIIAIEN